MSVLANRALPYRLLAVMFIVTLLMVAIPTAVYAAPTASMQCSGQYYRVKHGESLSEIARRYSVTVEALAQVNNIRNPSVIYAGQRLCIPQAAYYKQTGCTRYHLVRRGDTLSEIARHYGVYYQTLAQANGISNPNVIYIGQRICIPNIYSTGGSYYEPMPYGGPQQMSYGGQQQYNMGPGGPQQQYMGPGGPSRPEQMPYGGQQQYMGPGGGPGQPDRPYRPGR
jgi:LysM repeat protein